MQNSNLFSLNFKDLLKSVFMFFIGLIVTFIYNSIETKDFPTWPDFVNELVIAGSATLIYLIKQFLSGLGGMPFTKGQNLTTE